MNGTLLAGGFAIKRILQIQVEEGRGDRASRDALTVKPAETSGACGAASSTAPKVRRLACDIAKFRHEAERGAFPISPEQRKHLAGRGTRHLQTAPPLEVADRSLCQRSDDAVYRSHIISALC